MPSTYQSTIRVFVFLGLAIVCLQVTLLAILAPWTWTMPRSTDTQTASTPRNADEEHKDTNGEWLVVHEAALPAVTLKEACRGQYRTQLNWDGRTLFYCYEDFKITAVSTSTHTEHEIMSETMPEGRFGLSLVEAKQLGTVTDPHARLLLRVEGLNDCENDLLGCGYNYTIKLADLGKIVKVSHFTNSWLMSAEPDDWNATFTKGHFVIGMCEGGCIPEAIYGWNVSDGKLQTLTTEEAYLGQRQYDERVQDLKDDPYRHWGTIKWVDADHIEAELIDAKGKMTKLRREVK